MKRSTIRIIALIVVLALGGSGYLVWKLNHNKKAEVIQVSFISDNYWGDEQNLEGSVTEGSTQFVTKNEGMVKEFHVKVGDHVKKGDKLVTFDTTSYQLAVDHDKADVAVIESQIAQENASIQKYQSLLPSELAPPPKEIHVPGKRKAPKTVSKVGVGTKYKGKGTPDNPYVFECTPETLVTADFLVKLGDKTAVFEMYDGLGLLGTWTVEGSPKGSLDNGVSALVIEPTIDPYADQEDAENPEDSGESEITDPEDPDDVTDPEDPTDPTDPEDPTDPTEPEDPTDPTDPTEPEDPTDPTEPVEIIEDWILGDGVEFNKDGTATIDCTVKHYGKLATTIPDYDDGSYSYTQTTDPDSAGNYLYSREELAMMVKEGMEELKELNLSLREAKIRLRKDELVAETGKVLADFDGVVMELNDPDILGNGERMMTVKGNVNGTVSAYIGEMRLSQVKVGDQLNIMAYESGNAFTATVREIGTEPADGYSSWGDNPNNSYYPVICEPNEPVDLNMGEWCQVTFGESEQSNNNFYIPLAYVRDDSKGSYVLATNEKERLEKRYLKTGKIIWGSEIEVISGITPEDKIAFPYGKEAYEGNKTEQVDSIW